MTDLAETYACIPTTERGRGILISGDPKSDSIIYCNARSIIIRSLSNPLEASIYGEHAYNATVARFSPNGEWVASGDVSGTVRIWGRYGDRALKNEFRVLSGRIDDLQWSADGMRIVACGDGKGKSFVRAFMWDSGSNVGEFDGHSKRVLSCSFKPTRPFRIVTCGEDFIVNFYEGPPFKFKLSHSWQNRLSLKIKNRDKDFMDQIAKAAKEAEVMEKPSSTRKGTTRSGNGTKKFSWADHSNFVNCVRYSPDGNKFITVSSDKKGLVYDGKTGEKIGELSGEDGHEGSIYAVNWSPDSKQVLTVSADKTAKVWDITDDGNGKVNRTLVPPGTGGIEDMIVGCLWQNDKLVIVSLGGTISIFSATDPDKEPVSFSGHMKSINTLTSFLQDGKRIILTTSYDGVISRWVPGTGYNGKLQWNENVKIKCFAAVEGEIIYSGFDNKVNRVLVNGDQRGETESVDVGSQPRDLHIALESPELAVVSTDSEVILLRGFKIASNLKVDFTISASAIAPNGSEVIIGGEDGKLRIYCIDGDALKEEAVIEKHRGPITVISYSPDLTMFASADANREAVVWDRASREPKLKNMLYHTARINCLAWCPDNQKIATGSLDTSVLIYEVDKPASQRITVKGAHLGGVYGLAFVDDNSIVSAGEDACVRMWKLTA